MARKIVYTRDVSDSILNRYFSVTTPIFNKEIGERFKNARTQMKLSQKKMADLLGLTQTDISRLESGKMIKNPPTAALFKSVLGDGFQYMLCRDGYHRYEELKLNYNKQIRKMYGGY